MKFFRPEGVPLVFEAFDWIHGIFIGACVKSEATAAAEHTGYLNFCNFFRENRNTIVHYDSLQENK